MRTLLVLCLFTVQILYAANQTATVSTILPESQLPFSVALQQETLQLPAGFHSGANGEYKNQWVLLAGRTNGLHGFGGTPFPPAEQNTTAYVVDIESGVVYSRDISTSDLSATQLEDLSVTSPQSYTANNTLYVIGGYVSTSGGFETKTTITAIDLPKFVKWVKTGSGSLSKMIRQASDPWIQVTGGYLGKLDNRGRGILIFGQNFQGVYTPSSNGTYTRQPRNIQVVDTGRRLFVQSRSSESPQAEYRRRDLNVVPIIMKGKPAFVALSGVFTLTTGIWTVPVTIDESGKTNMENPNATDTLRQGMNNYVSATTKLYSNKTKDNYIVQHGGISYGYYSGGSFTTDDEFPFINQVSTVKMDSSGVFTQYLNNTEYPVILSTGSNPGNRLIFGAGANFYPKKGISKFSNGVINLDKLSGPTTVGYIIGGIMSTLANTNTQSDSTASPYIFRVVVTPR